MGYSLEDDQVALVGETNAAKFDVYIDGELLESAETARCGNAGTQLTFSREIIRLMSS